jgi:hypothetical protein
MRDAILSGISYGQLFHVEEWSFESKIAQPLHFHVSRRRDTFTSGVMSMKSSRIPCLWGWEARPAIVLAVLGLRGSSGPGKGSGGLILTRGSGPDPRRSGKRSS